MSAELIDPRGPRFGAAITSALSLTAFGIAVSAPGASSLPTR